MGENNAAKWVQTDDVQWVRRLAEDEFEVVDVGIVPMDGSYFVNRVTIDLANTLKDKMETKCILSAYGYENIEEVKGIYGKEWKQIVAECFVEMIGVNEESVRCQNSEALLGKIKEWGLPMRKEQEKHMSCQG